MWATRPRGNPPSVVRWPTKPGPSPRLRDDDSRRQEPRWNAGRRARPAGRAPRLSTGAVVRTCVFRRSASFFFLPAGKEEEAKSPEDLLRRGDFQVVRYKTPMHAHRGNEGAHPPPLAGGGGSACPRQHERSLAAPRDSRTAKPKRQKDHAA